MRKAEPLTDEQKSALRNILGLLNPVPMLEFSQKADTGKWSELHKMKEELRKLLIDNQPTKKP